MAERYDYTATDFPTTGDESPDDFVIAGDITATITKTADDIEKENAFVDMPPGEHLLVLSGFPEPPKANYYKVMVNGQPYGFQAHSVRVRLSLADNSKCSINDFFLLPPDNPRDIKAYFEGVPEGKKAAGWAANKFIHFINRLGFVWAPGQPFPNDARRLGNWKGRTIIATVEAGKGTYTDRDGNERQRGPQIKSFSYRATQSGPPAGSMAVGRPAGRAVGGASGGYANAHAGGSAGQLQGGRMPAGAGNGLDDI